MRFAHLVVIGVAGLTFCQSASALAAHWGPPEDLSKLPGLGINPSVGIDRAGHAYAAWLENSSQAFEEVVMVSDRPVGGVWTRPKRLTPRGGIAYFAQIAVSAGGDVALTWADNQAGSVRVSFRAAGHRWRPAHTLSTSSASEPAVAIDRRGNVIATWVADSATGRDQVHVASRRRSTGRWTRDITLSTGADAFGPRVASNARSQAALVWSTPTRSGDDEVHGATGRVGGARWTVRKLGAESDGGHPPSDATFPRPDIAVDGRGSATAVWTADAGQEVVSRLHARGAARWSRTRHLSRGLPGLHPKVAAAPKRGAVAAWTSPVGQRAAAMAARRVGYGAWGAPHVLSAPGVDDTEAAIAVDGAGRAIAGWDRAVFEEDSPGATRSSGWVVQAATMTTRGQWRAPVDLSERGENAGRPVLTLSPGGDGLAAWQRPIGEQGIVVQAAAYKRP